MIRTAASVTISAALFAILASSSACSSSSTKDGNKGGTGSVLGGSGGAASGSGGIGNTTGGTGGTTSTAGSGGGGLCAGKPVMCVDAMNAKGCDPDTGMDIMGNCAEEYAKDGFLSNGCSTTADGTGCTVDGVLDQECQKGAEPFAVCAGLTQDDIVSVYIGCFRDMNGAHSVIPCFADFVDETNPMMPTVDCEAAGAACLPDMGAGGAGPDPGTGGAPDGAGGAP
jgi:hypothetical protein